MKIAIYTRVSTEEQVREGTSLDVQREYLEEYAKREGHEVYKVYSDEGISGYSERRPALQELLQDAKTSLRGYSGLRSLCSLRKIAKKGLFSWNFFAPFNSFFLETEKSKKCRKNQKISPRASLQSSLRHSDDPWFLLYKFSKPFLFTVFQTELDEIAQP